MKETDFDLRKEELIKAMEGLTVKGGYRNTINYKTVNQSERSRKIIQNEMNSFKFIDNFLTDIDSKSEFMSEIELNKEIEVNELPLNEDISPEPQTQGKDTSQYASMDVDIESNSLNVLFKKGKKNKKTIHISED